MAPAVAPVSREPLLEVDLSDTAIVVHEHPDGLFTIDVGAERIIANAEQMREIVVGFKGIAKVKGWRR